MITSSVPVTSVSSKVIAVGFCSASTLTPDAFITAIKAASTKSPNRNRIIAL